MEKPIIPEIKIVDFKAIGKRIGNFLFGSVSFAERPVEDPYWDCPDEVYPPEYMQPTLPFIPHEATDSAVPAKAKAVLHYTQMAKQAREQQEG